MDRRAFIVSITTAVLATPSTAWMQPARKIFRVSMLGSGPREPDEPYIATFESALRALPRSLPIEQPSTFELVINARSAKALGLNISPSLLGRADRIIQ